MLEVLDMRNNSISTLPHWFDKLVSLAHLSAAGNPICNNGWIGSGKSKSLMETDGCKKQCSDMCLNIYLENNGCDYACNVPQCDFDNKQCL